MEGGNWIKKNILAIENQTWVLFVPIKGNFSQNKTLISAILVLTWEF